MRAPWLLLLVAWATALGQGLILETDLVQAFELEPGAEALGTIRLRNTGTSPLSVELALADYREAQGFLPLGEAPRSLGAGGLVLEETRLLLAPGEVREARFRVRAPSDLKGTRYAAILVTPDAPGGTPSQGEAQVGIRLVQRYAVLVLASHGGEAHIVWSKARLQEGRILLEGENQGDRYYYPRVRYQVLGSGGVVASQELGTFLFLPQEPKTILFPLPELSPGEYTMVVILDDGVKAYAVRLRLAR